LSLSKLHDVLEYIVTKHLLNVACQTSHLESN